MAGEMFGGGLVILLVPSPRVVIVARRSWQKLRKSCSATKSTSTAGYPRGLAGNAIPLWARLFAAIDALDAITSDRPYRKALAFDAARAEILAQSGSQFDPLALEAFVTEENTLREMVELKCGTVAMQTAPETVLRTPPSQHSGKSVL